MSGATTGARNAMLPAKRPVVDMLIDGTTRAPVFGAWVVP